jgi:hypothetical protein
MNALFHMSELRRCDHRRDDRDWLEAYREEEAACEAAAEAVRAACEAFKAVPIAVRNLVGEADAYSEADRAYDQARLRFQLKSAEIVGGVRAIAGIARHMQLASASAGRML